MRRVEILGLLTALLGICAAAQNPPAPQSQSHFRLSNLVVQASLEQELNAGGAAGYRLTAIAPSGTGGMAVLMEYSPEQRYEYLVINSTLAKHRFDQQLSDAGSRGFRLIPDTVLFDPSGQTIRGQDSWAVMQRAGGSTTRCEYRTVYTLRFANTTKDLARATLEGFRAVWLTGTALPVIIAERCSASPVTDSHDAIVRMHLEDSDGYQAPGRIVGLQFWSRDMNPQKYSVGFLVHPDSVPLGQRLLNYTYEMPRKGQLDTDDRWNALQTDLNAAGSAGYRVAFRPVMRHRVTGNFRFRYFRDLTLVMQRDGSDKIEYRIVTAESLPELLHGLQAQSEQGYGVVPMTLFADAVSYPSPMHFVIFMERSSSADAGSAAETRREP